MERLNPKRAEALSWDKVVPQQNGEKKEVHLGLSAILKLSLPHYLKSLLCTFSPFIQTRILAREWDHPQWVVFLSQLTSSR